MNHIPILKWVAGATISLPDELEFETEALLDLVNAHNLSGRFLQRVNDNNIAWMTPELLEGLMQLHYEAKQQVIRNITAFGELGPQLSDETRIVLVKGISTYILSGREETMRAGDIDLFSNNLDEVVQVLLNMNYVQTRAPFMHEIGEYTKNTAEFDLHAYFPVYRYTHELLDADLTPQHHPGIWQQTYGLELSRITFEDLEQHAHRGKNTDVRHIVVTDPNLQAIIICAHAFMNFTNMWSISHREKAYVRLGEIADLFTLVENPSFTKERFLSYVNMFNAYDAVEWAASVAVSVFGLNPLPVLVGTLMGDRLPPGRFPRCLWWNFWANLSSEADDLLRTSWLSMDWMTAQLGANRLTARNGRTLGYATIIAEGTLPLTRCITQLSEPIPLILEINRSEGSITIYLQVYTTSQVDVERVRVDFGNIASEWTHTVINELQTVVGFPAVYSFAYSTTGYELTLEFPWDILGVSENNDQSAALILGVARQTNQNGLVASTLIPLVIEF